MEDRKKPDRFRILVVDDDPSNLFIMSEMLGKDYKVKTAGSGEEALQTLSTFKPHMVLLDVMMPGMDGYEVCRRIREDERHPNVNILFVSAKDMIEERLTGYRVGGDDYITKPFDQNELLAKIKVFLRLRHDRGESLAGEMEKRKRQPDVFQKINHFFSSILYVQAVFPYCKIVCKSKEEDALLLRITIKDLENNFRKTDLLRVHRSYLVNPMKIVSFHRKGNQDYSVLLRDNYSETIMIPVGRSYQDYLKDLNPTWFSELPDK